MSHLAESILSVARSLPEGGVFSPKEFLHLGSRAAVDQTLSRLARDGQILRVGRGVYALPVNGKFGLRPPAGDAVVTALAAARGEQLVASGAADANALGLTTQVPVREVYLTSGPSQVLKLGHREIHLKHGKRWHLMLGARPAGQAIRALDWLGPAQAPAAAKALWDSLAASEQEAIRASRAALPGWMAKVISEISHG